jgi:hypothetical protein
MSKSFRPTLAALVGAATLSVTTPSVAEQAAPHLAPASVQAQAPRPVERSSSPRLGQLIERRLEAAAQARRHGEIEQLGALWLTLAERNQLDRVVDRGDGFLNVALRNQRRSELRVEARVARVQLLEPDTLAGIAPRPPDHLEERIDVERFVDGLDQPYRGAVSLALTGMNHREIADELGVSHAAARKWAERLRRRLRAGED